MANHKNSSGRSDDRINLDEPLEVAYWTESFGIGEAALRAAVGLVGCRAEAVRHHLSADLSGPESTTASTEFGLKTEVSVVAEGATAFRGRFKVFAARGAVMALVHADDGTDAGLFDSEAEAQADAALRAELWILEGGPFPLDSSNSHGY